MTNILLVDDDDIEVMSFRRAFSKAQIQNPLFHAEDGLVALDMLRAGTIPRERRVVLLDFYMPRMNGIEFLQELRGDPKLRCTPVVMLTGSSSDRDCAAAYALNVAGYLIKPTGVDALVECVKTLNRYWASIEMP